MSQLVLTRTGMKSGVWQGIVSGAAEMPRIVVTHVNRVVGDVTLIAAKDPGDWLLQVPVPREAISDGVQTVLITDAATDTELGSFTMIAGEAIGDDLRAEISLLRAELDMLKRAFRRHCRDTEN
ncbi:hypothetical protein [uncultured Roseobacter sp.]|uniref:hypothetical protein n=1 Tax=uncultured Roseobacter sp. TaxID=114847 RepID=UPI00260FD0BB|nr:hypothetical protein [uncultured Roseobacter sp.]